MEAFRPLLGRNAFVTRSCYAARVRLETLPFGRCCARTQQDPSQWWTPNRWTRVTSSATFWRTRILLAGARVEIAQERSAGSSLSIVPVLGTWGSFVTGMHPLRVALVATALDTAGARIEVQASLPKEIVNAWTHSGDLGVSRHTFLDDQACLACLYHSDRVRKNEDQIVAEALGFDASPNSAALMAVRTALYSNSSVDENWIVQIASSLNVERGMLEPFLGKPLRDLYQEGICGGRILATKTGAVEVPMAFQSAMAGIMLAAEIVKNRRGISSDWVTTKLNLLRPIGSFLSERQEKSRFGNCICQDEDFIAAYKTNL